jgi:hypothetical protein
MIIGKKLYDPPPPATNISGFATGEYHTIPGM